ncbi:MAG: pilus assembly protein [Coriobacteriales bacterium]|nr:pilus assembly protein [Coriobacteriales bacterium]
MSETTKTVCPPETTKTFCPPEGMRAVRSSRGQATVEAAVLLPVTMLLILVLCQPAILLYNRLVMENAAAEACRLLSTRADVGSFSADKYEGYVLRRLTAIPLTDIFHVGTGVRSWDITLEGGEGSEEVCVRIVNRLRPLPLLGWGARLAGQTDAEGYLTQTVELRAPVQPSWVLNNGGGGPADWTTQWD